MDERKIVLLCGKGISSNIVFNSINRTFGNVTAVIEEKENAKIFLKRRIKKLGVFRVAGQILFQVFIVKFLKFVSQKRINNIITNNSLETINIPDEKSKMVKSVNADSTIDLLKQIDPDLVIVNGTRIISQKVISALTCKFINTHAGITPKYRGVHGAYWALVNDDLENCGVTVHFVDEGIDTGNIIYQDTIDVGEEDNFVTYPFLQLAKGIKLLNMAIESCCNNTASISENNVESYLWYHPTIWGYLYNRIKNKVK
jgi:folate-dependent phosphoribosylglycinamide formyltransferase PurN